MAGRRTESSFTKRKRIRIFGALLAALGILFALAITPGASAQNDKKKKKNEPPPKVDNNSTNPIVPLTDEQQIDYMLSEYLGAWQLGDTERLHKYYSEDVSVVSGAWAAPVIGWTNFLALYWESLGRSKLRLPSSAIFKWARRALPDLASGAKARSPQPAIYRCIRPSGGPIRARWNMISPFRAARIR